MYINNINWQIVRVPSNSPLLIRNDGILTLGMTDCLSRTIFIADNLYGSLLRKVIIHELTHAWMFSYGYKLSSEEQEFICDFVASNSDDIISKADELICMGKLRFRVV